MLSSSPDSKYTPTTNGAAQLFWTLFKPTLIILVLTLLIALGYHSVKTLHPVQLLENEEVSIRPKINGRDHNSSSRECHPFVLYSIQKSGTHFFMEVVHHSEFYMDLVPEIFHKNPEADKVKDDLKKLNLFISSKLKSGKNSFILHYNQGSTFCPIFEFLKNHHYRIVLLTRDPFDGALSRALHDLEDSAHCIKGQECHAVTSLSVDPAKFVWNYRQRYLQLTRQLNIVKGMFPNLTVIVKYEDVLRNTRKEFDRVFEFLNCPALRTEDLESNYIPKHHKQSVNKTILNVGEVQEYLETKGYSFFSRNKEHLDHLRRRLSDEEEDGVYPMDTSPHLGSAVCA